MHKKKWKIKTVWEWLATGGGLGLLPGMPGTWGSLPGLVLGVLIYRGAHHSLFFPHKEIFTLVCLCLFSVLSYVVIKKAEASLNLQDPGFIVIDEIAGQAFCTAWFSPSMEFLVLGFLLFRFFDIVKPGPIRWVERKYTHSLGTLLDDLVAGFFALICLLGASFFFSSPL